MSLGLDRVCVIIGRTRHKMIIVELEEAVKAGARFLEVRLDFLSKAVDFPRLLPYKKCPWVATLRRREDGGRWTGTEQERKMILRQAIVAGFDWVDLEMDIAAEIPRFRNVKRIISYHNLSETPADLEQTYEKMLALDGDVYKVAVMANRPTDMMRVLNIIKHAPKPTVGHCMGDMGFPSRILGLKYGAPFIYAAFNKERGIAPGLPALDEVRRHYRIDAINEATAIYGLIGDPVAHSFSPLLHNQLFEDEKINAVYLPFRVPRGELQATIEGCKTLPVEGYSVTIPHKEGAAAIAAQRDSRVEESGAANTLVRHGDEFHAFNTDYEAALESLREYQPLTEDGVPKPFSECTALVLGAGGAARAIVRALHILGCSIHISSRTLERAAILAHEVSGKAHAWEARHNVNCDLLINCTPIGMHPNLDDSPVHAGYLRPGIVVFDTVYNPERTMLVKDARSRGCQVITGIEMFVRQAALQFQLFTQKAPRLEHLREVMRRALSPLTERAPIISEKTSDE